MAGTLQGRAVAASVFHAHPSNLLALTAAEEPRSWPTAAQLAAAPQHDLVASPVLFRMLQLAVLPEVLGENAGPTIYLAAKRFSSGLGVTSIQSLKDWFHEMHLGDLEVEIDEERVLVKLQHCLTCYGLSRRRLAAV